MDTLILHCLNAAIETISVLGKIHSCCCGKRSSKLVCQFASPLTVSRLGVRGGRDVHDELLETGKTANGSALRTRVECVSSLAGHGNCAGSLPPRSKLSLPERVFPSPKIPITLGEGKRARGVRRKQSITVSAYIAVQSWSVCCIMLTEYLNADDPTCRLSME